MVTMKFNLIWAICILQNFSFDLVAKLISIIITFTKLRVMHMRRINAQKKMKLLLIEDMHICYFTSFIFSKQYLSFTVNTCREECECVLKHEWVPINFSKLTIGAGILLNFLQKYFNLFKRKPLNLPIGIW